MAVSGPHHEPGRCWRPEVRRGEIEERFGKKALAHTDPLMAPYRSFCRNHMDYYLLVVRAPEP
ncbi:hypothetical protein OG302_39770 [Streptomyces sp. NBC_01283]|uniref:hypothetical protein n=1 Tax=Streptomyces sp. NBC_01283 TaxID=2903812 RepID=UPI00352BFDC9|nr:hypothetical protein OG302_39770 [Streptomyces sp. NBC_01283]